MLVLTIILLVETWFWVWAAGAIKNAEVVEVEITAKKIDAILSGDNMLVIFRFVSQLSDQFEVWGK